LIGLTFSAALVSGHYIPQLEHFLLMVRRILGLS
jgi:hypothetical protein